MKTEQLIKIGRTLAMLSFLIGTAIFVMNYLISADSFLLIGYIFIVLAVVINSIFLILIFIKLSKEKQYKTQLIISAGMILLNIPVLLLYSWITSLLLNTMRIRFVNSTKETITELKITGCQNKKIKKLEAEKSETVWISIKGDCTITIEYLLNGEPKKENVLEYATTNTGHKMKYKIGEK
ncbi:MAG: hypothetical protein COZ18_08325 [Flexibacter sp. CG_4_10_14_3_um_filter_32_15]|nr:MAG: hypothetical protein COZ18_08325 [Flexibacter sp. CG_4_10_14_3_um_filter_32_15]